MSRFTAFASDHRMTPAQLAIAWVRAKQPALLPLIGARTAAQMSDALGALAFTLGPSQLSELEALVPQEAIEGSRYAAPHMANLDSER